MSYYLKWFDRETKQYVGETLLMGAIPTGYRRAAYREMRPVDAGLISEASGGVLIDLDKFSYFVEFRQCPDPIP